jgi:hypothetical protein
MNVNVAFTLLFNTGFFPDACRAWQARAIADKTWLQFKLDFAAAHQYFRLNNQTAQQSGFQSANMTIEQGRGYTMQDTVNLIAQLATAMESDRGKIATLTATNAKCVSQMEAAQSYIKMLKDEILSLKAMSRPKTGQVNEQQQLLLVALSSGSQRPHERHLQSEKGRTPRDGDKGQHHGRRRLGKRMMRRSI